MQYKDWEKMTVDEQERLLKQTMFEQMRSRGSYNYPGGDEMQEYGIIHSSRKPEAYYDDIEEVSNV